MTIESLNWIKNIKAFYPTPGEKWAYRNVSNVFQLNWRNKDKKDEINANKLSEGDMVILRQLGKVTHIVEVIDNKFSHVEPKSEHEFNIYRNVKVIWITDNWDDSPSVNDFFEARYLPQGGKAHQIKELKAFKQKWGETGYQKFQDFIQARFNIN